ncbi:MAG: hypothetical protein KBC83_02355 [Candidatus Moranbacteria bacterium]|nr:hypothetical protein [Candidatus Moranbacteria bacterium]MBP9801489.1 hypothetical protein [Candidatus Moranbacteria bacterium]
MKKYLIGIALIPTLIAGCSTLPKGQTTAAAEKFVNELVVSGVPQECALFFGAFRGRLARGSTSLKWLWVTDVTQDCKVRAALQSDENPPREEELRNGAIHNGVLSFHCGMISPNTDCRFERSGEDIHFNAIFPGDGASGNRAILERI